MDGLTGTRIEETHPVFTAIHKLRVIYDLLNQGNDVQDWRIRLSKQMYDVPLPKLNLPRPYEPPDIYGAMSFSRAYNIPLEESLSNLFDYYDPINQPKKKKKILIK